MKTRVLYGVLTAALSVGCTVEGPDKFTEDLLYAQPPIFIGDSIYLASQGARGVLKVTPGSPGEEAYTNIADSQVALLPLEDELLRVQATADDHIVALTRAWNGDRSLHLIDPERCDPAQDPAPCVTSWEARPHHDTVVLSPDGAWALTWSRSGSETNQVVNMGEIGLYSLSGGEPLFPTAGFAPSRFAFTGDGSRVAILTQGEFVLLELATGKVSSRDLTLSTDTEVTPAEVVVTGDDHYALVTLQGHADLYTLDLTQESLPINIVSLTGVPSTVGRSAAAGKTLLLSADGAGLDVLDEATLSLSHIALDYSADAMIIPEQGQRVFLYEDSTVSEYLSVVDLSKGRAQAYLLDAPYRAVAVSDDGGAVVVIYIDGASGAYGESAGILNLAQGDRKATQIQLGSWVDTALFLPSDGEVEARVLLGLSGEGGRLAQIGLSTYRTESVEIPDHALFMGQLPSDGRVVVVHYAPAGLMTVAPPLGLDPVQFVSGYLGTALF